ncbi:MAG: phosphotransferase [bacterium]|nr:phosphotransferase [bacterium]
MRRAWATRSLDSRRAASRLRHNDLKLDTCMLNASDPDRVIAIFDWDMTTLGDPLIDLGTLLN